MLNPPSLPQHHILTTSSHAVHPLQSIPRHPATAIQTAFPSPSLLSSNLLATTEPLQTDPVREFLSHAKRPRSDTVQRVIDSSTIQLTSGYVTLDTVRGAGSTYAMPECMDKAPSYKLKGLLPKGTVVKVYDLNNDGGNVDKSGPHRVWIVRSSDDMIINRELVRSGFAFVRRGANIDNNAISNIVQELNEMETNARRNGLGIFKLCTTDNAPNSNVDTDNAPTSSPSNSNFIAQFEPLEYTTQTSWGDDGGKQILVPKQSSSSTIPSNPGDIKGCSDFATYEEALSWYETYYPYYGDVAKLDRRGKGVPCSGLPHTKNMERYRMKRPDVVGGGTAALN